VKSTQLNRTAKPIKSGDGPDKTTAPVQPGIFKDNEPEFVRVPQLYPRAGIKRGIAYRIMSRPGAACVEPDFLGDWINRNNR
jgi:hypothetical protein